MTAYTANVLAVPNVLGFWTMGESSGSTFHDTSGNNNNATIQSGITLGSTSLAAGDATTSALFNGSSGYATFASSSLFNMEYTQPWSIEALIEVTLVPGNGTEGFIFTKMQSGQPYQGWAVGIIGVGSGNYAVEVLLVANASLDEQIYVKSSIQLSTGAHHILVNYDGSGGWSGISIWIDGISDHGITLVVNLLGGHSIENSSVASIGVRGGTGSRDGYFPGNIQYVALYGLSSPDGTHTTNADYGSAFDYNIVAEATASIALLNPTIPTDPVRPNVIIDTDICNDVDDAMDLQIMCALSARGLFTIRGVTISSSNPDSASCAKAILNFWGVTAPVYAYQGIALPSVSLYTTAVAARFMPGDATNVGMTAYTITGGGTSYVVGDVLAVPGGTLAMGATATTLTVNAVSSGAVTGLTISNAGSYATAPSGHSAQSARRERSDGHGNLYCTSRQLYGRSGRFTQTCA